MPRVSKKKQRSHDGGHSSYPLVSSYREKTLTMAEYAPDTTINVRDDVKTRNALEGIPSPRDGDIVRVTLYKETWCFYKHAWHCTVAPEEAHKDPERKDLLIKCWAWGP